MNKKSLFGLFALILTINLPIDAALSRKLARRKKPTNYNLNIKTNRKKILEKTNSDINLKQKKQELDVKFGNLPAIYKKNIEKAPEKKINFLVETFEKIKNVFFKKYTAPDIVGFLSEDNTCFANVIFQLLFRSPKFKHYLDQIITNNSNNEIASNLKELFNEYSNKTNYRHELKNLLIKKIIGEEAFGKENNPIGFLFMLISQIDPTLLNNIPLNDIIDIREDTLNDDVRIEKQNLILQNLGLSRVKLTNDYDYFKIHNENKNTAQIFIDRSHFFIKFSTKDDWINIDDNYFYLEKDSIAIKTNKKDNYEIDINYKSYILTKRFCSFGINIPRNIYTFLIDTK